MKLNISKISSVSRLNLEPVARMIVDVQKKNGEIPWCVDGKTDPWDHIESIMGLTIGGYYEEARLGFQWMVKQQLDDGSWYAYYKDGKPVDETRDTNISSYIAVGVYHYYRSTGDMPFLSKIWNTVQRGIDFAISMQAPDGEIYWAKSPAGKIDKMALLTGSSSVFMSLKCAVAISYELNIDMPEWRKALRKLGNSLCNSTHRYNISKFRYSMYWFYPILSGALKQNDASKRINKYWSKYMVDGQGVRCVSDSPWITIAETCELVLALYAMGDIKRAETIFNWIIERKFEDGTYWCGYTFPDMVIWPEEKLTWTNAVVMMAADALYKLTPAHDLFKYTYWDSIGINGDIS